MVTTRGSWDFRLCGTGIWPRLDLDVDPPHRYETWDISRLLYVSMSLIFLGL